MLKAFFELKRTANAVLLLSAALFVTSCVQTNYNDLKPKPAEIGKTVEQQNQSADTGDKDSSKGASVAEVIEKGSADKSTVANADTQKSAQKVSPKASPKKIEKRGRLKLNAPWKCVPKKLKTVIYQVSKKFGHVTVNSTHRSRRKNRRIGGAKSSWHIGCRAVDFRVKGRTRGLYRWLRRHPNVGGLKRYRSGFYHIDIGPRRSW